MLVLQNYHTKYKIYIVKDYAEKLFDWNIVNT